MKQRAGGFGGYQFQRLAVLASIGAATLTIGCTSCGSKPVPDQPAFSVNDPLHWGKVLNVDGDVLGSDEQWVEVESVYADNKGKKHRKMLLAAMSLQLSPKDRVVTEEVRPFDPQTKKYGDPVRIVMRDARYKSVAANQARPD